MPAIFSGIYGLAICLFVFFGALYLWGFVLSEETNMQAVIKSIIPVFLIGFSIPLFNSLGDLNLLKEQVVVLLLLVVGGMFVFAAGILTYGKAGLFRIFIYLLITLFCWGGIIFIFLPVLPK